jgi:hypothetical protein
VCRKPKKRAGGSKIILDQPVERKKLVILLDRAGGLVSEWQKTAGPDIKVIVAKWAEWDGIRLVVPASSLPRCIRTCAAHLKPTDTGDKLVIRIAAVVDKACIVSVDSDFWNPDRSVAGGQIGDPTAPVCALLRSAGIEVITLRQLLPRVS